MRRVTSVLHSAPVRHAGATNDERKGAEMTWRTRGSTLRRMTLSGVLVLTGLAAAACGSDSADVAPTDSAAAATTSSVQSDASVATTTGDVADTTASETGDTRVAPPNDQALAEAALLVPGDVGDGWERLNAELNFPNDAELARTVAECADYAELVFAGGDRHGVGTSAALSAGEDIVFTYVVVFPTVEAAAAMLAAVSEPGFDSCWARFNDVAVPEMPFGVEEATYEPLPPPVLDFTADASTVKFLDGSVTIGGDSIPDTCVCAFAQVGRGVVEVHSAAPVFDLERRADVIQAAVDRLRANLGSSPVDVEGLLDAAASTGGDFGSGHALVADQVGQGAYDDQYRERQDGIEACTSVERPLPHGATYAETTAARGWLYVDTTSPQYPYTAHAVMILPDAEAAAAIVDDLRESTDFPECIAAWIADVNGADAANKYIVWRGKSALYTPSAARFGEPVPELGEDHLVVTWEQGLTIDGVAVEPLVEAFYLTRIGDTIFTVLTHNPDGPVVVAELAARLRDAMG